ncbi:stress-induced-phosphoprotein 1 [Babesia microti strain RI]|uniref:Hsp70-Hsp90 organising protein n=1 Tax=Babesia microti (strain RI) TaxID=1133968 RepID=I7IS44_BABMR|nr:stress-induced-phosphoprotein 1 [Babesia microti strain RI]CCF75306.2 stress-induced-phosphoprotein 1 [Babesia microti strain RI]|eukprot:XP_021337171.1 stress-induced-phosphoprotein 1 [Babesia microti strain RI]
MDYKALGNDAFKTGDFEKAVELFTKGIISNPTEHTLYSNRSGAYASLGKYKEALDDAKKCIELNPKWPKGYSRLGYAQYNLGQRDEAIASYKKGLEIDPSNTSLQNALREIENEGNETMQALMDVSNVVNNDPKLAGYAKEDPEFILKVAKILISLKKNPQDIQYLFQNPDPRLQEALFAIMGIRNPETPQEPKESPEYKKTSEPKEPEKELAPHEKQSEEFKKQGNEHYKSKRFNEALQCYDKAIELNPNNLIYRNNKAAVYLEMKEFDKCLKECNDAIDMRYEVKASFNDIAKVYNRMASCYKAMGKYDEAISSYKKSLLEDNNRFTRSALKEVERMKEKAESEAYIDVGLADQHREKGNELFNKGEYPAAIKEYDEGVRRNPKDPKIYNNRAAAYMKLLEYPFALKDCEKALEIDPNFSKAWARKGNLHMLMKEYQKALQAYDKGLAADINNQQCSDGKMKCIAKIQEMSQSGQIDEEQYRHAMADPEIQAILGDPQFHLILKKITESPECMEEYMKDPKISNAVNKLIAAGIIQVK